MLKSIINNKIVFMAKETFDTVKQRANMAIGALTIAALSGAALTACNMDQQRPYCVVDDGEYRAEPSVGVMYFGGSREYIDDAVLYGEKSAKHYALDTFVYAANEQLEPGTPISVRVTAAETQTADSWILAQAVAEDLAGRGLAIGRVGVTVQEGTGHVNPLVSMEPMCDWN